MPKLMSVLSVVGTAAMLWVGGNIVIHGFDGLGASWLYDAIHHAAAAVAHGGSGWLAGFAEWAVTAFLDGVFGLALGLLLIPFTSRVLLPLIARLSGKTDPSH
jgi:predicted DNA repair protein MutK